MPERGEKNESLPISEISLEGLCTSLEDENDFSVPDDVNNEELAVDESTEVVSAAPEKVIPHPLNSTWTFWYYLNDKHLKWEENQQEVQTISTIEGFWAMYHHIDSPSQIKIGCDYSLFKEGIRPMWEDPANINGGRWSVALQKHQRNYDLDPLWMNMLTMVLGEDADDEINKDICGVVVSVRNRGDRLALWTATSKNKDLAYKVGRRLKEYVNLNPNQTIEYNLHSDTSTKRSSTVRALYTV